jgi:hypothetical protein
MSDSSVVVVGNGESRKKIDLTVLSKPIIGCNAIHRDIITDHLVCCDRRMVQEAIKNPQTSNSLIYVRLDWYRYFRKTLKYKNIRPLPSIPYQGNGRADRPIHWGSGSYAILLAATLGFTSINILGFDLYGVNGRVNNVYKDTENYSASSKSSVDYSYWIYQISRVFELFPQTQFHVYNTPNWIIPELWMRPNVKKINIGLVNQLNNNYNNT